MSGVPVLAVYENGHGYRVKYHGAEFDLLTPIDFESRYEAFYSSPTRKHLLDETISVSFEMAPVYQPPEAQEAQGINTPRS